MVWEYDAETTKTVRAVSKARKTAKY